MSSLDAPMQDLDQQRKFAIFPTKKAIFSCLHLKWQRRPRKLLRPNQKNSLFPVARPGLFSPKSRIFFFENVRMRVPCACVYLHAFERSCTRWIKLLLERLTLHCTRCLWTWRSAARSMLSSPTTVCLYEEDGWSLLLLCWCRSNAWSEASAEMEGGPAHVRYVLPFVKAPTRQPKKKRQLHQLYSLNVSHY